MLPDVVMEPVSMNCWRCNWQTENRKARFCAACGSRLFTAQHGAVGRCEPKLLSRRTCPHCGSRKLRRARRFECARGSAFAIVTPRKCKSCGHTWEPVPPRILLIVFLLLGCTIVFGTIICSIGLLAHGDNGLTLWLGALFWGSIGASMFVESFRKLRYRTVPLQ